MVCYYKEMFGLGFIVAFMMFTIITIFEEAIGEWFKRIINHLK